MKKLSIKERTAVLILRFMSNGLSMSTSMDCAIAAINEIKAVVNDHTKGFIDTDIIMIAESLDQMIAEINELKEDLNKRK